MNTLALARPATQPRAAQLWLQGGGGEAGVSRAGRETWGQARLGRQPRAWKHNLFLQLGPGEPEGLAWLGWAAPHRSQATREAVLGVELVRVPES